MDKLARQGGIPFRLKPFPKWPFSDEREIELVEEVIKSGKWWRMSGSKVDEFERRFADLHNAGYCLGVTNGTHAIELAIYTLGIGRGDEVIVPVFTFISTASAVIYCNATPIFVDVDPVTFCMQPESFEKAISPRTKAVIPVHIAGHSCDMDSICKIAHKHGIRVIEDAAHAHGAEWRGRKVGTFGDVSAFSFQNGKLMTCGEGGALLTNNKDLFEKAYLVHGVGRPKGDRVYAHVLLGSNYRMNEFQAAILIAQMERLEHMNKKREENSAFLDRLMADIPGIRPQGRNPNSTLNPHYMYMFYYHPEYFGGLSRQEFVDILIEEGIPAYIAYPMISDTQFFKDKNFGSRIEQYPEINDAGLQNARKIAENVVWLPHFTLLGDEQDIYDIAGAVRKIYDAFG